MYHILNFYAIIIFLKFIVHKMNFKIVKYGMVVLTRREKADVTNTDVFVGWML
jgi:hypothetical protein